MAEQPATQLDIDPVGGMRQRIGAQILQEYVEQPDRHKPDDEHDERRIAAVGQDLVDDHLKEEWRNQRKQLNE